MRKVVKPMSVRFGEFCGRTFSWAGFWLWLPYRMISGTVRTLRDHRRVCRDIKRVFCDGEGLVVDTRGRFIPATLREALCWTCHVCAEENWLIIARGHPTQEQAVAIARVEGAMSEFQDSDAVPEEIYSREIGMIPRVVRCRRCGARFVVECPCGHCSQDRQIDEDNE
jgi:hypothetical protein